MSSVSSRLSSSTAAAKKLVTASSPYENAKTVLLVYFVLKQSLRALRHLRARGITSTFGEFWRWVCERVLLLVLQMPSMKKKVQTEMNRAKLDIEAKLVPQGADVVRHLSLPAEGKSPEWIMEEMIKMDKDQAMSDWRHGKLSGAVYHGGDDLSRVLVAAFERYAVSNPLHPDVFPAVRKMEAEIVAMCLRMYNNPDGAGTMTSGGTESIVMAVKTYRDWARATKGITEPEMIIPATAHAAFDKGAAYMGIKVHTLPVDPRTRKVNIKRVRRAINPNTILLVGSAVNFPDGNQDDVVALGKLASSHNIGLHVDCCLGSFIMPFLERAGLSEGEDGGKKYKLEPFDFRVKGVTSISCDTHKYGFAPKGSSVIMYRDAALRRHQYYITPNWTGGVYGSPSLSGSRPGALIAGTWAAMQYMGSDGYLSSCREIVGAARAIANTIADSIPELDVLGNPPASVVAFTSSDPAVNILEVGDAMAKRGWHLNALSGPPAVHIACTKLTVPLVDTFVADLRDAIEDARAAPSGKGTMVALYGLGQSSAVGPSMVTELAATFIDTLYKA
ncbi:PLP-dependent transferase [Coniophora puteana RWD-64-598 SS2]|uniref:sphinganine-1-phosphate aldolase n=1 Tax=Coniophora puteana (strain RWD-64-598) TaxID=741705 RepID=A0A5M3MWA9_CONPW|nr:PLP-dependent transferase [Coniophora puteana RWD-64-598 SS2]EIW83452.1 PLP-dependent transferase [Coniophora puteana RWD-64-598 SS2]